MPSILLDKCCCCVPLRLGALIIGYVLIILEAFLAIEGCVTQATFFKFAWNTEDVDPILCLILVVHVALILLFVIEMASSIVLVIGLHTRRNKFVQLFYIIHSILLTMFIGLLLGNLISAVKRYGTQEWLRILLPNLVIILFQSYSIFIVIRYYLKNDTKQDTNQGVSYSVAKSGEVETA